MSDNTGMAIGQVRPIIYFEKVDGFVILAPYDEGHPEIARWVYDRMFRALGFEFREARTLTDWRKLEAQLVKQVDRDAEAQKERYMEVYDAGKAKTASALLARRRSVDCGAFERTFIDQWLGRAEAKRKEHQEKMFKTS